MLCFGAALKCLLRTLPCNRQSTWGLKWVSVSLNFSQTFVLTHTMDRSRLSATSFKPTPCPAGNVCPLVTILEDKTGLLDVQEGHVFLNTEESTKGKCPQGVQKSWNDFATTTLLKQYKEKWIHCTKGNLCPNDWEHVTRTLNNELGMYYTCEQVRKRIDTLLKKYKKEKEKTNDRAGLRSSWKHFEEVDTLWSTSPQCRYSSEAFKTNDCQTSCMNEIKHEEKNHVKAVNDGEGNDVSRQSDERNEVLDTCDAQHSHDSLEVVAKAQKVKEPRRTHLGSLVRLFGEGLKDVAETVSSIEKERHQHEAWMLRESQDHEERMLKLKLEEETNRLDMYLGMQSDVVNMWASNTKPKQSIILSANQNNLYDTTKAEVINVVADIKESIEMTQEKALSWSFANESADSSNISISKEIVSMFRYICKGYVAKILKVEEEVKHLKKQLAEKERICLDLNNLVDELLVEPGAMQACEVTPVKQAGNPSRVFNDGTPHEQEAVCTSFSNKSILDDDAYIMKLNGKEILLEVEKETEQRRLLRQESASSAGQWNDILEGNKDGLLLPWLVCEEAIGMQEQSGVENASQEQGAFIHSLCKEDSVKIENSNTKSNGMQDSAPFEQEKTFGMNDNAKPSWLTESSFISVQSTELISQKIQFRKRVEAGELLLCIGTLQIHEI